MTEQEFQELLAIGHELSGLEFKGPGLRTEKEFFAKVVRAVLGMANRRGGGLVIIGVTDHGTRLEPVGLSASELATWKYDDVADGVAGYAEPSVSMELEKVEYDGANYVVLRVAEFQDIPVLCKRDYQGTLRKGACYVRSPHKPETSEIPSQEAMRALLDLATEKRLRAFVAQAHVAGLATSLPTAPSNADLYERQLKDLR